MPIVGIDLGTTFSAVAYLDDNGKPVTIPNAEGELTTPSVVLFDPGGDVVVGREARRVALSEPARVAEDVKRYMGDEFYPKVINGQTHTPAGISALILRKLKQDAERRVGAVEGAVITVPAYFDEARRQATAAAGRIAGLRVLDIINEPTSAALAYAYGFLIRGDGSAGADAPRVVVVYDLGGGTFDVTVVRIAGKDLRVLATAGDVRLGGRDWDERLFDHMAGQFLRAHGQDPRDDPMTRQLLMLAAEETKKVLSQRKQTRYVINHAGINFTGEVTRDEFDAMTEDLLYRSEIRLVRVLEQAKLTWAEIDRVLAVGGSTRMPQVGAMLRRVSGKDPDASLSPDEAVAQGAAIHAAVCLVRGVQEAAEAAARPPAPPPLPAGPGGTRPEDGASAGVSAGASPGTTPSAIPGNNGNPPAALPPLPDEINPDEGQWGALVKRFTSKAIDLLRSIRTTNVNAHSLGVVTFRPDKREQVSFLIGANTPLPVSVTRRFGTMKEGQEVVTVRIMEGESDNPAECIPVGSCQIKMLPWLPKGSPIHVTFTYDNSGRLHASALEPRSGTWGLAVIQRQFGLQRGRVVLQEKMLRTVNVS